MDRISRLLIVVCLAACFTVAMDEQASAQYPVAVVPTVTPVGYAAETRGLWGRRVVYRPVYATTATAVPVAPVTVARPVIAAPSVTVARPVITAPTVTVARPVIAAPTVTVARPLIAAPTVTVAPVRVYRPVVPVTTYYSPVIHF